jgi:hypothetical protein
MNNLVAPLIKMLIAKQDELEFSDVAFSEKIGMSRQMWAMVKNGDREPGKDFLVAIMKAFPEYQLDVANYLKALADHPTPQGASK